MNEIEINEVTRVSYDNRKTIQSSRTFSDSSLYSTNRIENKKQLLIYSNFTITFSKYYAFIMCPKYRSNKRFSIYQITFNLSTDKKYFSTY